MSKRSGFLSVAHAGPALRTRVFLLYLFLVTLGNLFIASAVKFVAFDLSESQSVVSLISTVSSIAFITVGLFSGIIVDAFSRKLFATLPLLLAAIPALLFYCSFTIGVASVGMLFTFILLRALASTFNNAANWVIFYDLCGTQKLSLWISRRSIVVYSASMTGLLVLTFILSTQALIFLVYVSLCVLAYLVFTRIGYQDQNQRQNFKSAPQALRFFIERFRSFILLYQKRKDLQLLLMASFIKTLFIFWPMASGALFKFGIEQDTTRRLYLLTLILMDGVTIAALYLLGRKKTLANRHFVLGMAVSGLGIWLLALVEDTRLKILSLSVMYVGLAISQIASSYVLRILLPTEHRAQGLAFSVVPYYLADIVSGVTFAVLLSFFNVNQLLLAAGAGLMIFSVPLYRIAQRYGA